MAQTSRTPTQEHRFNQLWSRSVLQGNVPSRACPRTCRDFAIPTMRKPFTPRNSYREAQNLSGTGRESRVATNCNCQIPPADRRWPFADLEFIASETIHWSSNPRSAAICFKELLGMLSANCRKCEQTGVQSQQCRERLSAWIDEQHHGI